MARSSRQTTTPAPAGEVSADGDVGFRPLYKQIKDSIVAQLIAGEWRPGDKLPNEFDLADRYRVSQGTVRKALDELTVQRLLVREQGRGTFVATHNPNRALFHFFHLVGSDGSRKLPTCRTQSSEVRRATREEEEKLELPSGSRVVSIERVRDMGGRPAIVERIVLSAKRFPRLADVPHDALPNTLYTLYEEEYGVTIYQAEEHLRAVAADAREAAIFEVPEGHPLQEVDRLALGIDRRPVEWRVSHCDTRNCYYVSNID